MAKGEKMVAKYQAEMKINNVHKKYIARVSGKPKDGTFTIDKPLFCSNPKHSRHAVAITPEEIAQSKPASTTFTIIWYDEKSDTSLLYCYPLTGRTHQIRVHLQHAGHSIVNDVNYGGKRVGNVHLHNLRDESVITLGKRRPISWLKNEKIDIADDNGLPLVTGEVGEKILKTTEDKMDIHLKTSDLDSEKKSIGFEDKGASKDESNKAKEPQIEKKQEEISEKPYQKTKDQLKETANDEEEEDMKMFFNYGDDNDLNYTPFNEDRIMEIWLHSYEYTILGKTVKTHMPYWAEPSVLYDI